MVAVVFPDSSYIDEKYHGVNNQELENIRFQAFSLHGTESHRDEKGGLGDMVTLGGMLTAGRDLEQVMDEVKSYYGAKDKDDLENKRSQYGKMKKEKVKN